eukprot:COSAG02_NODE_9706_length_2136_cov_16.219440_2_plen_206_part_00
MYIDGLLAQRGISLADAAASISVSDMMVAVRQHLPGTLATNGINEGQKAIIKSDSNQMEVADVDPTETLRARAGLQFCVGRAAQQLWQQTGAYGEDGPSDNMLRTAVFLAAVNEYMCAELLELAGCSARTVVAPLHILGQRPPAPTRVYFDRKICPRDVFLAITGDEELLELTTSMVICGGGVVPVRNLFFVHLVPCFHCILLTL